MVGVRTEHEEGSSVESQLYITTLLGEVEEGYMGMYVPLALANVLDKFSDREADNFPVAH